MKLKWRIFGFLLGFCGLLLLLLWLLETVFLNDMYKFIRRLEMDRAIAKVEKNIDSPDLEALLEQINRENEIMIDDAAQFKPKVLKPSPEGKERPRQETLTRNVDFTKEDGATITLTFHARITPVDATVKTLRIQLFFITGIMLISSVVLALVIARHVSKPMEEINKSAKSLSKGDYGIRFQARGFVEIQELSNTLNTAAGELSRVEEFRRELMTNIAHDLRTPLSFIYSYAEMMHDFPDEILPEHTEIIMEEVRRLSSLVQDVFEISKLENGIMQLNGTTFNLTHEIGSVIKRLDELVKKDGYTLEFISEEEVTVYGDLVKIDQAIYNLLLNAIHYSGEDKMVQVIQSVNQEVVKIAVTDHGEGIGEHDIPYIWDRYYKVDKNHKRAATGTGLGLSIVKKIIHMHGGEYGVESQLGVGSTFWFQIPAREKKTL